MKFLFLSFLWAVSVVSQTHLRSVSLSSVSLSSVSLSSVSLSSVSLNTAKNCTDASDCSYNGICTNEKTCKCNDGYITYPSNHINGCNYKQKSTLVAFLLQFFIGMFTGAGYLYLGQIGLGLGQLFLFWGGTLLLFLFACCSCASNEASEETKIEIYAIYSGLYKCLLYNGCFIWLIYSLVEIGSGTTKDGNGASIPSL